MKIRLIKREHSGIGTPLKDAIINGKFEDYYKGENSINEKLLIQNLPQDFLPTSPEKVLIFVETIQDDPVFFLAPKGQTGLKAFLNWHKDHDTFLILLCRS
jgi:hypothetical protein